MLSFIGGLVVFSLAIGVIALVWESVRGNLYQVHIYIVPEKQVFIFSRGNQRIVFDTLSYFKNDSSFLDADVNDLYISKYAPKTNSVNDFLALDKDNNIIAVVPVSFFGGDNLAVHKTGQKKPKWMKYTEFQEKQFELLQNAK
jgi:hypothetical protein